uniref:Uncharacterized protein n=1 Tax=Lygus hesperus TaxID=30085 RepID=A0A0K8ST36_LYGHE
MKGSDPHLLGLTTSPHLASCSENALRAICKPSRVSASRITSNPISAGSLPKAVSTTRSKRSGDSGSPWRTPRPMTISPDISPPASRTVTPSWYRQAIDHEGNRSGQGDLQCQRL